MLHYVSYLDVNGFKYNKIVVPHDSRHGWWGTGDTIYEVVAQEAKKRRWNIVDLAPYSIADGINKAKTVFPNCHFNKERCDKGLKELRNYKYEINEALGAVKETPLHDWSSHGADSFRYA
jgi:hypothetical protein